MPLKQPLSRPGHYAPQRHAMRRPAMPHRNTAPASVEVEDTFERDSGLTEGRHQARPGLRRTQSHQPASRLPKAHEPRSKSGAALGAEGKKADERRALWKRLQEFAVNVFAIVVQDFLMKMFNTVASEQAKGYASATAAQAAAAAGIPGGAAGAAAA